MIVRMPERRRSATLKQSAPPANDSGSSPSNSSVSRWARFAVTAWSGRPDRYIVGSRSKTVRQFSTSSVFDSLRPKPRPRSGGDPLEAAEHRDGVGVLEVVPERGVRDRHVAEAEVVVDDPPDAAPGRAAWDCT